MTPFRRKIPLHVPIKPSTGERLKRYLDTLPPAQAVKCLYVEKAVLAQLDKDKAPL